MQIDREALSRHYQSLSDDELLALDRHELTEVAQQCYDDEMESRGLLLGEGEEPAGIAHDDFEPGDHVAPDWLDTAECATSFSLTGSSYAEEGKHACDVLLSAGVPCDVLLEDGTDGNAGLLKVMVPMALHLKASAVLDKEIFNKELESAWVPHLEALSDDELRALHPDAVCAGWLDLAARYKRIYQDELARRR